ncbi:hypothetical protein [Streptomyces sp. NPDC008121]|uniref:hypothetical protein n=1 Tax=Streptomyces sp. NPDC008121 TaxID=3364809 RepID=UPI0036E40107
MPDNPQDPCDALPETQRNLCDSDGSGPPGAGGGVGGDITDTAANGVVELARDLIETINELVAPKDAWAPADTDSALYAPFLWLGQHLAVSIFVCVVVVCALTAWQGAPRMRQMGASTGWTLAAVAAMGAIPGAVMLLNKSVSAAFKTAFDSNENTLFEVIRTDLGAKSDDPLAVLLIVAGLVVALAFAALVFMTRQLGIIAFVCMAPLVLASLARGGDTTALKRWVQRLLGLLFAPFALLLVAPFVSLAKGVVAMDLVLLVAADAIMLRMIFHGVPYFGPRLAGAARTLVERHTTNPVAHTVMRAGAPTVYEQENTPRDPRTVSTPGRAMSQDGGVLLGAYGVRQRERPGRLTTESAVAKVRRDTVRTAQLSQARREARAAAGYPVRAPRPAGAPPAGAPGPAGAPPVRPPHPPAPRQGNPPPNTP